MVTVTETETETGTIAQTPPSTQEANGDETHSLQSISVQARFI